MKKIAFFVVVNLILFIMMPFQLMAHSASQSGILMETLLNGNYYIGGERVGWSIDEDFHTNGTTITYKYNTTDMNARLLFMGGMSYWSNYATFTLSSTGTGALGVFNGSQEPNIVAKFYNYYANATTGHLTSWQIDLSSLYLSSMTSKVPAHEIGHAFGLNDLYSPQNYNKIMCGYADMSTATALHIMDIQGFRVITGLHASHLWSYKYYETVSGNNRHVKYCTQCNGFSIYVTNCVYNANNVCITCGTPRGEMPE